MGGAVCLGWLTLYAIVCGTPIKVVACPAMEDSGGGGAGVCEGRVERECPTKMQLDKLSK